MHENNQASQPLSRFLQEIAQIAEDAAMTGQMQGGLRRLIDRYNAVLTQAVAENLVPVGMFQPLGSDDGFEDLNIEARLLRSSLSAPERPAEKENPRMDPGHLVRLAPFLNSEDLGRLVRSATASKTHFDANLVVSLAPFLDQESLGEIVRESLLGQKSAEPQEPEEPEYVRAQFRPESHELRHYSSQLQTEEPALESAPER